jgi:hypothetical protein
MKSSVLHEMSHIKESEKILHFDYIVIKPVGINSAISSTQLKAHSFNTGHIINAGVLYILESGLMKVMSTTGAILFEKNIGFDVSPSSGMIHGEIASIVSSPNPEDMHIAILTKRGKILKYPIRLEKLIDPSEVVSDQANVTENQTNLT